MKKILLSIVLAAFIALSLALAGCKAKTDKMPEEMRTDLTEPSVTTEEMQVTPNETVATETIPPTATPEVAVKTQAITQIALDKNKEIQTALKKAGLYTGAIDGKIGPKTKMAIEEFQKAKGLKVDGKVGPKTWAELQKYLTQ